MKNYVQLFCFKKKHLFIYFWLHWFFVAVWAFCNWGERGLLSTCGVQASREVASLVAEHGL